MSAPNSKDTTRSTFRPGNEDGASESSIASLKGSDRVFPIRSFVSVNPSATQAEPTPDQIKPLEPTADSGNPISLENASNATHDSVSNTTSIGSIDDMPSIDSALSSEPGSQHTFENSDHYITARHEYVMRSKGHNVLVARDKEISQRCEDEPIRTPGAIQSFGVIIALREESPDQLVVRVVSENSESLLGYSPQHLLALRSFTDLLIEEEENVLKTHLDYVREDGHDLDTDGPEVFLLSIPLPCGEVRRFWCATHVAQENKDIIICEFELEDDQLNPLNVDDQLREPIAMSPETTPTAEVPTNTLGATPTSAKLAGSTVSSSKSFRALRYARHRKGQAAAMQILDIMSPIQDQLSQAPDFQMLLEIAAGLVKELVGFHRVLIYQFDSSWNGKVVTELVEPQVSVDLYKGLHFPASDIPAQARKLYKVNKVRLLYDRDHQTSRLVCKTMDDLQQPLDMTHAYLRAMSPIHTQYLANMGVRSSMSISINAFGNLWGLISCHSYGDAGMRVSFPIRKLCRLIGDTVARNIERIQHGVDLQTRMLVNTVPRQRSAANYIVASSDDLIRLLGADSAALVVGKEAKLLSRTIPTNEKFSQEIIALLEFLRIRRVSSVLVSQDIPKDFPEFHYRPGLKSISGLLCLPLSPEGESFLVFFRRGQVTTVNWAGNPHDISKRKASLDGGHLTPRQSFQRWTETILTQSRIWTESEIATANVLASVYSKFIQVWRQKEVIKQNTRLTRLLVSNSAHEIRTPLNAIINYLELALEGTLDEASREDLVKSHSASKSLVHIINDLLDLTTAEHVGNQQHIGQETFSLPPTFLEATAILSEEAKRKHIDFFASVHPDVPAVATGDRRRVRQVFINLISNAVQHTSSGFVKAVLRPSQQNPRSGYASVEIVVTDSGSGISEADREQLFQELEQVSSDDSYCAGNDAEEETLKRMRDEKSVLGLGLAVTAHVARTMHGSLSFKSEEGKGTQFKVLLQFECPEAVETMEASNNVSSESDTIPAETISPSTMKCKEDSDEKSLVHGVEDNEESPPGFGVPDNIHLVQDDLSAERKDSGTRSSQSSQGHSVDDASAPIRKAQSNSRQNSELNAHDKRPLSNPSEQRAQSSARNTSVRSTDSPSSSESHTKPSSDSRSSSYFPDMGQSESSTSDKSRSLRSPDTELSDPPTDTRLTVLVADDDPINSKIIKKRLENIGHKVFLTSDGKACVEEFTSHQEQIDVILMDIQMPIMCGMTATKVIRGLEVNTTDSRSDTHIRRNRQVPIFAVSASIIESDEELYIAHGFDAWVMKPINFARLNTLLDGVHNLQVRKTSKSSSGDWESGGWFAMN